MSQKLTTICAPRLFRKLLPWMPLETKQIPIGRKREVDNLYQTFYYGDSKVEVGMPFSISCIISIADQVEWHKDGEPIRQPSNIRHGKDEHSYFINEMGIPGNILTNIQPPDPDYVAHL